MEARRQAISGPIPMSSNRAMATGVITNVNHGPFTVYFTPTTLLPILTEWVVGVKYTVKGPWFTFVITPVAMALLLLMGIGPLIAWRRASIPNLRRQFAVPTTA